MSVSATYLRIYMSKYTYEPIEKKLDFSQLKVWKRAVHFLNQNKPEIHRGERYAPRRF